MVRLFVSYVKEDLAPVQRLAEELRSHGIDVWLDRSKLLPGQRWADVIRQAISEGDFFLACFSNAYEARSKTYMNEELTLAIEELRQRSYDAPWFIPAKLDDCEIPARPIGAGETLRSLHWADLHADWAEGVRQILAVVRPQVGPLEIDRSEFEALMHRLDSPIRVTRDLLDKLSSTRLDERRREALLEQAANELTNWLAQFSRLRVGILASQAAPPTFPTQTRLEDVVRKTVSRFEYLAKARRLRFDVVGFEKLPSSVLVDQQFVEVLLYEILQNAVSYSEPGSHSDPAVIRVAAEPTRPDQVCINVSSRSLPIAAGDLERVFERGFRTADAAATTASGAGIGLFMARRMTEALAGKISIQSNVDSHLTTVRIELPTRTA